VTGPVRAVVFDLDDTLLDHRGSAATALGEWLPTLGVVAGERQVEAWFEAEERHFPRWSAGEITHVEHRRFRMRDFLPAVGVRTGDDDDLDRLYAGYLACYRRSWTTFDDVDAAVARLRAAGIALAVLSNGLTEQQLAKVEAVGLSGVIGPVVTAEEVGVAKPDPEIYLTVCARLGVAPGEALHVGDRYDLDVLGPRAAGLRAVHLDRRGQGPLDEVDRITSLDQLEVGARPPAVAPPQAPRSRPASGRPSW
jgi:putative hydrolase of the HAD superfamily